MKRKFIYLFILFFLFLIVVCSTILLISAIHKPDSSGLTGFTTSKFSVDNETGPTLEDGRKLFYVGSFVVKAGETIDQSFEIHTLE